MKTLIVYAHHEPGSMNGALLEAARGALARRGEVVVSDLYAMGFNPLAGAHDFAGRSNPAFFKYQAEQVKAWSQGRLAPDIAAEQRKLAECDLLLLQFPLWWFSVPAVLKGWIDRVLTPGFAYGGGRLFEQGPLRGRRALVSVTTGGLPEVFAPGGRYGDLNAMLHHLHYGTLAFCGLEVLQPFVVHAPARIAQTEREAHLARWQQRLADIDRSPMLIAFEPQAQAA